LNSLEKVLVYMCAVGISPPQIKFVSRGRDFQLCIFLQCAWENLLMLSLPLHGMSGYWPGRIRSESIVLETLYEHIFSTYAVKYFRSRILKINHLVFWVIISFPCTYKYFVTAPGDIGVLAGENQVRIDRTHLRCRYTHAHNNTLTHSHIRIRECSCMQQNEKHDTKHKTLHQPLREHVVAVHKWQIGTSKKV
jgi:hypothetical protein